MRIAKSTTTVVRMKGIGLVAGVGAVVALAGAPAALNGQERETKTGWQPYLGCWQPQLAASGDVVGADPNKQYSGSCKAACCECGVATVLD